ETGRVGAGTGATVGKILGIEHSRPGGVGAAEIVLPGGGHVSAFAAVNAFGDIVDPATGRVRVGAARDGVFIDTERALLEDPLANTPLGAGHTTLLCVATTVPFDTASLKRVAIEAHDGVARAVRPTHSVVDGDVVFALAPAGAAPPVLTRLRVGVA